MLANLLSCQCVCVFIQILVLTNRCRLVRLPIATYKVHTPAVWVSLSGFLYRVGTGENWLIEVLAYLLLHYNSRLIAYKWLY